MNTWLVMAATAAVRGWTWLYTLPLDAETQTTRRREIESDVWEFRNDRARPVTSACLAAHLVIRAALGVPDDLLWICSQVRDHLCPPRFSTVFRFAIVVVAASGLAVSASSPPLDAGRILAVNVASSGWVAVQSGTIVTLVAPSFAFTLTNIGDRPTSGLQVNAVFYRTTPKHHQLGTAFSPAVGWHGLPAGGTSRTLVLRGHGWDVADAALKTPAEADTFLRTVVPDAHVRLFVRHAGRWASLGDYPLRAQLLKR